MADDLSGSTKNGQANGLALIEAQREQAKANQRAYHAETELRRQGYLDKLQDLHGQREQAMALASNHAGKVGLIYRAETNSFYRVVVMDDFAVTLGRPDFPPLPQFDLPAHASDVSDENRSTTNSDSIDLVQEPSDSSDVVGAEDSEQVIGAATPMTPRPARPLRPPLPVRPKPPEIPSVDKKWDKTTFVKSTFAWLASLLIGVFVGFGLINIVGLGYRRPEDRTNLIVGILIGWQPLPE